MAGHFNPKTEPLSIVVPNHHEKSNDRKEIKHRKVGIPKFLRFLYQILECEDPKIISWASDGTSIQILDMIAVADIILPKYFKHSNYASFQRQLNYFGFRKWTKSQTNICTFSHPEFLKHFPDRMCYIKRKNRPERIGTRRNIQKSLGFPSWNDTSSVGSSTNSTPSSGQFLTIRNSSYPDMKTIPPQILTNGNHITRQQYHHPYHTNHTDIPPLHGPNISQLLDHVHFPMHTPLQQYRTSIDQNNSRQQNQDTMWYYYPA